MPTRFGVNEMFPLTSKMNDKVPLTQDINSGVSGHVETVVLLSRKKVNGYVDVDLDVEKIQGKSGSATYKEIQDYVLRKYGFKVHSGYIGQIKTKAGLDKRENYNIGSGDGQKVSCPQEKEDAIMDAFRHFNMI